MAAGNTSGQINPDHTPASQAPHPSAATPLPTLPAAARNPAPPLRAQALQQAARTQQADAAPVVHVTIDRIDVRLPAPTSDPAPARKARPASTLAPLGEYLRAHNGAAR